MRSICLMLIMSVLAVSGLQLSSAQEKERKPRATLGKPPRPDKVDIPLVFAVSPEGKTVATAGTSSRPAAS